MNSSHAPAGSVELQPLNTEPESSYLIFEQRWRRHAYDEPRVQKRFWVIVAVAVVVGAGVIFAATSTAHKREQHGAPAAAGAGSSNLEGGPRLQNFPAEPYLAPFSICQLDTQSIGPEQQVAVPLNYNLWLNLSNPAFYQPGDSTGRVAAGFNGRVNITMHTEQDASCLSLHARNLSFSSIAVRLLGTAWKQQPQHQQQDTADVCLCGSGSSCLTAVCGRLFKARPGSDAWIISLGPYVAPAGATLLLQTTYTAAFGSNKQGIWRSAPYPDPGAPDRQVVALASEFETSAARMVLPCLDEPRYKATFSVEIDAPAHLTVLSNSPTAATRWILNSADSSMSRTTFQPTPPMSTYLLSIAVGELKAVTGQTSSGQAVRVWTTPDTISAAAVPLQLSVLALQHYQNFTGLTQSRGPDTKWDLLAVPGKTGAVENWKLLMMDPERFLYSSGGAWDLFRCANVICHEIAHQWFGNLVTAASWPDLLVNEGLATLAEYGCMAAVLPSQVGLLGAAVLMRGMYGAPPGVNPGVHEGPFDKTLSYDASPLAQPLLGSGMIEFAVPVYSKAAALMAMVATYAAAAGATDTATVAAQQYGSVAELVESAPTNPLQDALRAHLQQHAFSTATAPDTLARIIQLAPADMSSNTLEVITGWQSPGAPLIQLTTTPEGMELHQRRFCSWGLLDDSFLTQLLASAGSGGVPAQVPTPPVSTNSSQASGSSTLICPTSLERQERAVPWTPVYVAMLPAVASSAGNHTTDATNSTASTSQVSCGQWVVVKQDQQAVTLPAGCEAVQASSKTTGGQISPGYIAEGDGGWGIYRSLYSAAQRAVLRQWVSAYVRQASSRKAAAAGSNPESGGLDAQLLLTASKVLQDQAALSLSAFGEVPGGELWDVLMSAVDASAAAGKMLRQGSSVLGASRQAGFGTVLYTLLAPLLPAVEVWTDKLAANKACWVQQQERLSQALAPVAAMAMAAFAGAATQLSVNNTDGAAGSNMSSHSSPDQFLGAMALNILMTTTALVHADTASKLCQRFNDAAAAAGDVADAAAMLSHIAPDLQHAVLDVAAAQPPGCQLDWSGDKLFSTLRQWYLTSRDARIVTMVAFALAHFPARGFHSTVPWQDVLSLLLALNSTSGSTAQQSGAAPVTQPGSRRVSGISIAKHAVELSVLVSRAITLSNRFPQPEIALAGSSSGTQGSGSMTNSPVLSILIQQWPQLVASAGEGTAWDVLREVSVREVLTVQQWQSLAEWAAQQLQSGGTGAAASGQQVQCMRVQAVLGASWSTVTWLQANIEAVCK